MGVIIASFLSKQYIFHLSKMYSRLFTICFYLILFENSNCVKTDSLVQNYPISAEKHATNFELSQISQSKESEKSSKNQNIGGTNLTTGVYYCIQDTKGLFLIWDGNVGYGLMTTNIDECHTNYAYQFELIIDENEKIGLKNRQTDRFVTHYYYTSSNQYYLITNTSNADYLNRINLVVRNNGLINIKTSTKSYYLSNSYSFITGSGIYVITAVSTDNYIANWTFIKVDHENDHDNNHNTSNSTLNLKINSFEYVIPDEEVIDEHKNEVNLISPTIVNNTSSSKITHEILHNELISERLFWEFDQNFTIFRNVTVIRKLPEFFRKNLKCRRMNSSFKPKAILDLKKYSEYLQESDYNIKKTIDIQPEASIMIEAYLVLVENLPITFTANGVVTARDKINGTQIASIIKNNPNNDLAIVDVLDYSVIVKVSGHLEATLTLNDYFNVINIDLL